MSDFKLLDSSEIMLEGKWELLDGRVVADITCNRIDFLIMNFLTEIAIDKSGWQVLYQDSRDGRYWERIFLHGEWHGGGPSSLKWLDEDTAKRKYNFMCN